VGTRFLKLYDCKKLTESFLRNKSKRNPSARCVVEETSTSILFGATFNVACFQGLQIRNGISRRFLNYCGDGHGRTHALPKWEGDAGVTSLFRRLKVFSGKMEFDGPAEALWKNHQNKNRIELNRADRLAETERNRLNSAPTHVLKIAMIFECTRAAASLERAGEAGVEARIATGVLEEPPRIRADTLDLAIGHVEECLKGARFLEKVADRAKVVSQGEVLLAKIWHDFGKRARDGIILLSRGQISAKYAHHPDRQGSITPEDIYLRIIPELERQGMARLHSRRGKLETYAFRKEE
jgi:hypothetical protein